MGEELPTKNIAPRILLFFETEGKIKTFLESKNWSFVTHRPALQKTLKEGIYAGKIETSENSRYLSKYKRLYLKFSPFQIIWLL